MSGLRGKLVRASSTDTHKQFADYVEIQRDINRAISGLYEGEGVGVASDGRCANDTALVSESLLSGELWALRSEYFSLFVP